MVCVMLAYYGSHAVHVCESSENPHSMFNSMIPSVTPGQVVKFSYK